MLQPSFIERVRRLPYTGQVIVEMNDFVTETQPVARIGYMPGRMRRFQAASDLRVSGKALKAQMLLPDGAPVEVGEPLAASYCFGERLVVTSPFAGYLGFVSRNLGHIYIREPIPVGSGEPEVLDIPASLGVRPFLIGDCLRVIPGQAVVPGQVIATRKAERQTLVVQSSQYGKVTSIVDGVVTIKPLHVATELLAYLAGRVTAVMPGQGVVVRAFAHLMQGQYGVGGETGGGILMAGGADSCLGPDSVTEAWRDRVVVAGATMRPEGIAAAVAAGAKALVMAYLPLRTLLAFSGGQGTVGLTGDEDVPLTIVLTEGFTETPISARVFQTLSALEGRYAAVNGATHIRAGVIRPEVVVCHADWPPASCRSDSEAPHIAVGMTVRIIRAPHAGQVGTVLALPEERQVIATGSAIMVAEVQLNGGVCTVPVSNLEAWGAGGTHHG